MAECAISSCRPFSWFLLELTVMNNSIESPKKSKKFYLGLMLFCLMVVSCVAFPNLPGLPIAKKEPTSVQFGPGYTTQEHQARTLDAIWNLIEQNYIYYDSADVDWDALHKSYSDRVQTGLSDDEFNTLIAELESKLPAGSLGWQSRADRVEADLLASSTYQGIGAFVAFKAESVPHVVILSVMEGSPAEKAGLKAHDSILSIDNVPVDLEEGLNVVQRIRGPAGSTVTLEVQTPGRTRHSITVTRGQLASTGKLEADQITRANKSYGYLLFPPAAYDTLTDDVHASLQTLASNRHLDGLILDLRVAGSAGGWPLEAIVTMFEDGDLGEFYTRTASQEFSVSGQDVFGSQTVPLVALVGQNTVGFPEILAASLQANKRALIVGAPSSGSIETPSAFYLPDGSEAFIQTTSFRLPNGDELGQNGIKPDVPIEADWDEVVPDADPVLEAALEALGAVQ
jgi:carboxyl-terminal processing protease